MFCLMLAHALCKRQCSGCWRTAVAMRWLHQLLAEHLMLDLRIGPIRSQHQRLHNRRARGIQPPRPCSACSLEQCERQVRICMQRGPRFKLPAQRHQHARLCQIRLPCASPCSVSRCVMASRERRLPAQELATPPDNPAHLAPAVPVPAPVVGLLAYRSIAAAVLLPSRRPVPSYSVI